MSNFQKEYFEEERFWEGSMLMDSFNKERIEATIAIIPEEVRSLVDVGCGNGIFLNTILEKGSKHLQLLGVDRSRAALKHVKTEKKEGDITSIPLADQSYDCVTSLEVIEHLTAHDFKKALSELARISKRYIIISVPYNEKLEDNFTVCPSCRSVFNKDFHLRTFSEDYFCHLLDNYGYKNVSHKKLGPIQTYKGYRTYKKLFSGNTLNQWSSPICPICGYKTESKTISQVSTTIPEKKLWRQLTALPKYFWPKQINYYWILGLFEKKCELMRRVRVIPVLLLRNGGVVKSVKFKNHRYVGDPINVVKIFNEKEIDEIVILDIDATKEKRGPDMHRLKEIASEAFVPVAYGGGITTLEQIKEMFQIGVEKVVINSAASINVKLIADAAAVVGSQSIVVSVDVKKSFLGGYRVYTQNGTNDTGIDPVTYCKKMQEAGAGEIFLNNMNLDGTFEGFDNDMIRRVTDAVSIPVIVCGGAGSLKNFKDAILHGASAVAAGSYFIFQRPHKAVLVTYPSQKDLQREIYSQV